MGEDAFEESEMHDGSPIVRRDKLVSRRMAALLSGTGILPIAIGIFVAFANDSSQKPLPAAALPFVVAALLTMGVAFGVMGILFGVLRTVVTKKAVHVKYGPATETRGGAGGPSGGGFPQSPSAEMSTASAAPQTKARATPVEALRVTGAKTMRRPA